MTNIMLIYMNKSVIENDKCIITSARMVLNQGGRNMSALMSLDWLDRKVFFCY